MTEDELIERHPRLYHMAADGSWPAIRRNGLLSVSALLDLYGTEGAAREAVESMRRPECVVLRRAGEPDAVVRDNKPMTDAALTKCLQGGLTPRQWYETLNRKSFLWADRGRVDKLLGARAYRGAPQLVLTVGTAGLLAAHRERVRLARINTGATLYVPQPRGSDTFMRIDDFPSGGGRVGTAKRPAVVEVVVEGGLPDAADHVVELHRVRDGVWERMEP